MQSTACAIGKSEPNLVSYTQFPPGKPEIIELKTGELLSDQLMQLYPDRNGGMHFTIWRNSPSKITEINPVDCENITVKSREIYVIQFHPAGGKLGTVLAIVGIAVAAVVIGIVASPMAGVAFFAVGTAGVIGASLLMPVPPHISADTANNKTSGSNYLDQPKNQMRNGSRVPEVFGRMRVWPDLIAPAYVEFNDNYMQVGETFYCISEGYCDVFENKLEQTKIDSLDNFNVTIYRGGEFVLPRIRVKRPNSIANNVALTKNDQTDYYELIGDEIEEIHWEIYFTKGLLMYKTGGGTAEEEVEIKVYWRTINADNTRGSTQSDIITIEGTYENPFIKTIKKTVAKGRYEASVVKNSDGRHTEDNISVNDAQLAAVSGVQYVDDMPGKGRTYIHLKYNRSAVTNQQSILFNYNCIAQRYLPRMGRTFTNWDEQDWGLTSWVKDAIAYTLYSEGVGAGAPIEQIDLPSLADCSDYLYSLDPQMAEFNAVLDKYMSVEDQLAIMCSASRISICNHYGKFYFTIDRPQDLPVALFNRRNRLATDESNLTINFRSGDEPDALQIEYRDRDDNYQPKTYTYPLDVTDPINPKKIDGTGIIYKDCVYRRARYEWDSLKYRRRIKSVKVTEEAQMLMPLDLVAVVEPWAEIKLDGEVKDFDYDTRTVVLDQELGGLDENATIKFRSLDGTEVSDLIGFNIDPDNAWRITLDRLPPFEIAARSEPYRQVGTLYDIGIEAEHNRRLWLVIRGEITKNSVSLSLVEYAPSAYDCDLEEVPT